MQRRRARLSCVAICLSCASGAFFSLQELPAPEQKALTALPNSEAPGGPGLPPAPGSMPADGADIKNNLEKFTESLHHKASQVTAWVMQLSEASTPRATKLLGSIRSQIFGHCSSSTLAVNFQRFVAECQLLLDGLEKNFMALAECAHNLENSDISDEFLGVTCVTSAWVMNDVCVCVRV